jgi:hypothetical protein
MLGAPAARLAVALVIAASILGTIFRVATAPERVKERRETARTTCTSSGGVWVEVGSVEMCRTPGTPEKKL